MPSLAILDLTKHQQEDTSPRPRPVEYPRLRGDITHEGAYLTRVAGANIFYQQSSVGGYDLKDPSDRVFAFDYDHSGKFDHLVVYRNGLEARIWILKNTEGTFSPLYQQLSVDGYGPSDCVFAFDYDHRGMNDYFVMYRPGVGWLLVGDSETVVIAIRLARALRDFLGSGD